MVQSIELLFDERTDGLIRGSWDALAAAGLPSLASHTGETNRPHVTLAVGEAGGFETVIDPLRAVFAGWGLADAGFAAEVGSPVLFGGTRGRWVLARQIVASRPLLTLHAAVHRALGDHDALEQTLPDRWTPHVTLARRIDADRIGAALAVVDAEPIPCRFVAARLWDATTKTVTALT